MTGVKELSNVNWMTSLLLDARRFLRRSFSLEATCPEKGLNMSLYTYGG